MIVVIYTIGMRVTHGELVFVCNWMAVHAIGALIIGEKFKGTLHKSAHVHYPFLKAGRDASHGCSRGCSSRESSKIRFNEERCISCIVELLG